MATLTIESNGMLEFTAVYYNGQQIAGLKELYLHLDEDGTFESIIQYEGSDKKIYTKNIFSDYMDNIRIVPPSFTEEEAANLVSFSVESTGYIDDTILFMNENELDGVVNVFLHIKATKNKSIVNSLLKKGNYESVEFKAQVTYRNEDDSLETEDIFQ